MIELDFNTFPEIRTSRLVLRRMTEEDTNEILEMRSSEAVMQYIDRERAENLEDAHDYIKRINSSIDSHNGIMWGIELKNRPGKIIGNIGYWRLVKEHFRAEIGYMLLPHYWRKGFMKEAIRAVIDFGFSHMKLHTIEANINPGNTASGLLLESVGFRKEAYFKENYYFNGKFHDSIIYSLVREE
ncbi:MAG: GNAT family N-acetyltransferase [Bacteroidota bacterium]|nr:GNAT family N-acetyltransferase [Bacteroidota bacterium]